MRASLHETFPQWQYEVLRADSAEWLQNSLRKSLDHGELSVIDKIKAAQGALASTQFLQFPTSADQFPAFKSLVDERQQAAKTVMKGLVLKNHPELAKAGVATTLGYNFYDLRAPVFLIYPVNVPFRNMLPRVGRVNDGYGTAAHWKATRSTGSVYAGVSEGNRNQVSTPDENDYVATYKELGMERSVTFTAQFAGEGYADNLADEHLRGLQSLWLQEEGLILLGNSGTGTGNNGFALGTPTTPTVALQPGAGLSAATNVSVAVVAITALGYPVNAQYGYGAGHTVSGGLVPSFSRTNADGSSDTINGGTSAISAMSAVVATTSGNGQVVATTTAIKGAFAYAWFVNTTDASSPSLSNAKLAAITQFPTYTVTAAASGTQTGAATGLNADHSFNTLDFDGLLSYAASTAGAYWKDLGGASLTSGKNGRVNEIETVLESIFNNYQAGVDEIWGSPDAVLALDAAIRYSGTNASGFQFFVTRDQQGNILGGFVVSQYQSRFSASLGATVIPIRYHPMIPSGTLYFHLKTNPYPHDRVGNVAEMLVQRDYYSIEWPQTTRRWPFGTYVHEVIRHNMPWIPAVLTGIGPFVGN